MAALDFPDNPSPGDTFDSGSVLWWWTGTTWEIVGSGEAPISPGSDVNSAGDLSTTGEADLGVSVTWTAVAGRRYMVTCEANISSTVATDSTYVVLTDQANSAKVARYSYTGGANRQAGVTVNEVITATSDGSLTRKGRFGRIAGTGTVTAYNRANAPAVLIVIDLGP